MSPLGSYIVRARERLGWDRRQLAVKADIPYTTLRNIELNDQTVKTREEVLQRLAVALGVPFDELRVDISHPPAYTESAAGAPGFSLSPCAPRRHTRGARMAPTPTGLYPVAQQQPGFKAGVHFLPGNDGRLAVALHIAQGGYQGSVSYLRSIGLSAHFIISEGGSVAQMVNTNDSAQAQGLRHVNAIADLAGTGWAWMGAGWYSPRGKLVRPTWALLRPGMNTNRTIISIEHAGYFNKPRPRVQLEASIALLRWLGSQYPTLLPYQPGATLIGHRDLDTIDRVNCPGPYFDFSAIAAAANSSGGRYRVAGLLVYQRQDLTGPIALELPSGTLVDIDKTYPNGAGHLKDDTGFVDMARLERM